MTKSSVPVFRISFANATIVSGLYLLAAVVVEVVRRTSNARWSEKASFALEAFPAHTLDLLGLLEPLRRAAAEGHLSGFAVRVIYGLVTVGLVFSMGLVAGGAMWLVARMLPQPPPDGSA